MDFINKIAFIFGTFFILTFIFIHLTRKDLNHIKSVYSLYALGKYGWLVKLALILISINQVIISINLIYLKNYIPAFLITLSAIGSAITGIVETNNKNILKNKMHDIGAYMYFLFLPISIISYSNKDILGYILLISSIVTLYFYINKLPNRGLVQKTNIIISDIWLILTPLMF
jgi:hypothetical protein